MFRGNARGAVSEGTSRVKCSDPDLSVSRLSHTRNGSLGCHTGYPTASSWHLCAALFQLLRLRAFSASFDKLFLLHPRRADMRGMSDPTLTEVLLTTDGNQL